MTPNLVLCSLCRIAQFLSFEYFRLTLDKFVLRNVFRISAEIIFSYKSRELQKNYFIKMFFVFLTKKTFKLTKQWFSKRIHRMRSLSLNSSRWPSSYWICNLSVERCRIILGMELLSPPLICQNLSDVKNYKKRYFGMEVKIKMMAKMWWLCRGVICK